MAHILSYSFIYIYIKQTSTEGVPHARDFISVYNKQNKTDKTKRQQKDLDLRLNMINVCFILTHSMSPWEVGSRCYLLSLRVSGSFCPGIRSPPGASGSVFDWRKDRGLSPTIFKICPQACDHS